MGAVSLADVIEAQHGVVSREQALSCGLSPAAIRHRLRPGGPWQPLVPGVYATVTGMVSHEQRCMGALLHAGSRGVVTGPAALRLHGMEAPPCEWVDVLVPVAVRRSSSAFARIHRTVRMPELVHTSRRLQYVPVPRAVADTARSLTTLREVRSVVAGAVQRRRCPIGLLAMELHQGPDQGSGLLRAALAEVADGIRSAAEGDFRDLLKRARLPMPMFNAKLLDGPTFLAIVDAWWPEHGVAAEVDSREWHLSPEEWQQTMARHARLSERGIIVLHFTPLQIRRDGRNVAATIRSALANAPSPAPGVRALPTT